MKLFYFIAVLILVSCNGHKKTVTNQNDESIMESSNQLDLLLQESDSDFELLETVVIRDSKRLVKFYSKLNRTRKPGLPIPVIDFSKEMIVIQCMGKQKGVGLPALNFHKETDSEIILNGALEKNEKAIDSTISTAPFCIYRMPISSKTVLVE